MDKNLKNISVSDFAEMTRKKAGRSSLGKNCARAFLFGAAFCVVAQLYYDLITSELIRQWIAPMSAEDASAHTSLFMIFLGSFLTVINVYDNIGKIAGAGSIVPISGFANSVVSPAMEYRSEGRILGSGAQMFVVAGPVLVYGCTAAVVAGVIWWFVGGGGW